MSEQSSPEDGDVDAQHSLYMLFLLVLVFFVMGLVGFLICHILKKKGYRCRTFHDELDLDNKESLTELQDDEDEEINDDTVEKIVKCIIQNEANVEVLKEMLADGDTDLPLPVPVPSGLCPHRNSQDGGLPHHHTVHLGSTQAPCIHCSRKKRHPLHRQGRSKEGKSKMHPGETTVFSVGRFHVTHIGKKPVAHEAQEESVPEGKQDVDSADASQGSHCSDKLQREGSQNGVVHSDSPQQRSFQQAEPQSGKVLMEDCGVEPSEGINPLSTIASSDVSQNKPERKEFPKRSSLQEPDLLSAATGKISETNCLVGRKHILSDNLKEMKNLDKIVDTSEDEGVQRSAKELSENKESQSLQARTKLDMSGNEITKASSIELKEQSLVVEDPGVSL
uniref:RELT like 2 n=1 Tax=Salvator merianae TaxID=96440 RepID=A0A8D0E6B2_SALMN